MEYFISVLLSGISVGGQYALIAIGYTMVYGILRLINFAHGDVFMVAGLMGIYFSATLPLYLSLPLILLLTVLLGVLIESLAYRPLRTAPRMSVMISAIGVSYLLQNTATYITGGQPMTYPAIPFLSNTVTIAGTPTKYVVLLTPVLVIFLVVVLTQLINHTKIGMAMRAASVDFETSQLMGIKINSVISMTFVIGSALAAIGSVLYFNTYPAVTPTAGYLYYQPIRSQKYQEVLVDESDTSDHGTETLPLLSDSSCPTVVSAHLYVSSQEDADAWNNEAGIQKAAQLYYEALCRVYKQ